MRCTSDGTSAARHLVKAISKEGDIAELALTALGAMAAKDASHVATCSARLPGTLSHTASGNHKALDILKALVAERSFAARLDIGALCALEEPPFECIAAGIEAGSSASDPACLGEAISKVILSGSKCPRQLTVAAISAARAAARYIGPTFLDPSSHPKAVALLMNAIAAETVALLTVVQDGDCDAQALVDQRAPSVLSAFTACLDALLAKECGWADALPFDELLLVRNAIHTFVNDVTDFVLLSDARQSPVLTVHCARAVGAWLLEETDDNLDIRARALRCMVAFANAEPHLVLPGDSGFPACLFVDYAFSYALPAFLQLVDCESPLAEQILLSDTCVRGLALEAIVGLEHYVAALGSHKTLPRALAPVHHASRAFDAVRLLRWVYFHNPDLLAGFDVDVSARLDTLASSIASERSCRALLFGDDDDEEDEEDTRAWRMASGSACWLASTVAKVSPAAKHSLAMGIDLAAFERLLV